MFYVLYYKSGLAVIFSSRFGGSR